jgi:hypothetical protein
MVEETMDLSTGSAKSPGSPQEAERRPDGPAGAPQRISEETPVNLQAGEGPGDQQPAPGADDDDQADFPNKRRHPRAQVDLLVQMRFGSVQEFLNATAEDLSVGGMFLRSAHFGDGGQLRETGQLLVMQFDAGDRRMVEGLCKVVRVVTPDEPGLVPGVGVEFVELDDKSRRLIEAIVAIKLAKPFGE